jgi:hypothetical protein
MNALDHIKLSDGLLSRSHDLTCIVHPDDNQGWRDIYKGGWQPAFFNQQWGGAQWGTEMVDGATGSMHKFDVATGYIENNGTQNFFNIAGSTWGAQGFKTSEALSVSAIWIKAYRVGTSANSIQAYILPDDGTGTKPTGTTPVTNGTATPLALKVITTNTDGDWYRIVFPTPVALLANTVYHFVIKSTGAVDAANYLMLRYTGATKKYPFGNQSYGDATPVWTASATNAVCFLVESTSAKQFLQASGQFNSKLTFAEGSPLNQSKALCQPLKNFFNDKEFSFVLRGNDWTKDKTVADFLYGLDHDRIVLRCNASTGYPQIDLYEQDSNKLTVTGTVDVSVGYHDIGVYVRAKGDGADVVELWVDGVKQGGSLSAQTITFDPLMKQLGTAWLGGGFNVCPAWTQKLDMSVLPSAAGWTWTGTGTEANCMSVSGGKLYQNGNGYASTDTGYYLKSAAGFSNTNGWSAAVKNRVLNPGNSVTNSPIALRVDDGSKYVQHLAGSYYSYHYDSALWSYVQADLVSSDTVAFTSGKGGDLLTFYNGRLTIDGTAKLTAASASNQAIFGDPSSGAGDNGSAVYDYVAYYNTAAILPQCTSGSMSEFAFWGGNKSQLFSTLYNQGTPISVKQWAGLKDGYVKAQVSQKERKGITSGPTTTSTTAVPLTDMDCYVLGNYLDITAGSNLINSVGGASGTGIQPFVDGQANKNSEYRYSNNTNAGAGIETAGNKPTYLGLHKVDLRWLVGGASTGTAVGDQRKLTVKSEVK